MPCSPRILASLGRPCIPEDQEHRGEHSLRKVFGASVVEWVRWVKEKQCRPRAQLIPPLPLAGS
jgi:hypothetical protein